MACQICSESVGEIPSSFLPEFSLSSEIEPILFCLAIGHSALYSTNPSDTTSHNVNKYSEMLLSFLGWYFSVHFCFLSGTWENKVDVCFLVDNFSGVLIVLDTGEFRQNVILSIGSWHLGIGMDCLWSWVGPIEGEKQGLLSPLGMW